MTAFTAINRVMLLVVMSLFMMSGCAQNSYTLQEEDVSGNQMAILRDITISGSGPEARIEISADKPLTYTSYSLNEPFRTILDLSQADPGEVIIPQPDSDSLVKKIDLSSTETAAGSLVRITIETSREVDFVVATDPKDSTKLLLTIPDFHVFSTDEESQEKASLPEETAVETPENIPVPQSKISNEQISPTKESSLKTLDSVKTQSASSEAILAGLEVTKRGVLVNAGQKISDYKYFTLSKPQRLVLDIFHLKNSLSVKSQPIRSFGVTNARIGTYPGKIRIVFDSAKKVFPRFAFEESANGLFVDFSRQDTATAAVSGRESGSSGQIAASRKRGASAIESLDFTMLDGFSRISVTLSGTCAAPEPVKTSDGLMLTFSRCHLPKRLRRPFDTSAFPSAVKEFLPYQITTKGKTDTKVRVSLRENRPYTFTKEGNVYNLDIKNPVKPLSSQTPPEMIPQIAASKVSAAAPLEPQGQASLQKKEFSRTYLPEKGFSKKTYTGRRVTLEFADADVRKIFQLIAEVSNLNFLVGDDVSGTISLKLVNVPWDKALDVILDTRGLGMKRDGNIVVIRPKGKLTTLADEELAAKRAYERTLDLHTKIFDINFATVKDIAKQFGSYKSERGKILVDERTNRVIVNDIDPALERMTSLLKALDIPERQVLIEARIVEASSSFTRDLGIQWGIHYTDGSASLLGINSLDTAFGGIVSAVAPETGFQDSGTAGSSGTISFGKLTSNVQVDLRLAAAAEVGQVKIISTPKVVTLNNKAAKISQGQMVPYSTVSAEGTKTEFVEAALTLEVTPHITADGSVSMKIKASNNSVGDSATGTTPPINKKEATTELLVKNGETTVIGGIYVDTETNTDSGVPFLMDIPLLGWLFKSNSKEKSKSELLIFITPKIVG